MIILIIIQIHIYKSFSGRQSRIHIFHLVTDPQNTRTKHIRHSSSFGLLVVGVVDVDAHDLAAVLALAGHEVEVRLGLQGAGVVAAGGLLPVARHVPPVLGVVALVDGPGPPVGHARGVPGSGRPGQAVGRPRTRDHAGTIATVLLLLWLLGLVLGLLGLGLELVVVVMIVVGGRVVRRVDGVAVAHHHLPGPREARDRGRRRLLLGLEGLEGEVRVGARGVVAPGVLCDQVILKGHEPALDVCMAWVVGSA